MNHQYGPEVSTRILHQLFDQLLFPGAAIYESDSAYLPICIWGSAGIGKTSFIKDYAAKNNIALVHLALAQLEEMGDLLGMPQIQDQKTIFARPQWVPQKLGPGILLLDDFNRADIRIIKGIMQLLQDKQMLGWHLPERWRIVLTANPDSEDYQVSMLDQAIITRMMHFRLAFDFPAWKSWAHEQGLESQWIDFLEQHPEVLNFPPCTPRTYAQFCQYAAALNKNQASIQLNLLAESLLGPEAAAMLLHCLDQNQQKLPNPMDIINTTDFEAEIKVPIELWLKSNSGKEANLFYQLSDQIKIKLQQTSGNLTGRQLKNLKRFMMLEKIPADIRFQIARKWAGITQPNLQQLFRDPELAQMIM